jgi:hypothetical protein
MTDPLTLPADGLFLPSILHSLAKVVLWALRLHIHWLLHYSHLHHPFSNVGRLLQFRRCSFFESGVPPTISTCKPSVIPSFRCWGLAVPVLLGVVCWALLDVPVAVSAASWSRASLGASLSSWASKVVGVVCLFPLPCRKMYGRLLYWFLFR